MKAIVFLRTWKNAKNPRTYARFETDKEERYLFEAEDLNKACLKVLSAFPASKCIGFAIKMENGDFCCQCCKDYYFYGKEEPTDEEIVNSLIEEYSKRIKDDEDVAAGLKEWVEDPYTGKLTLRDVAK